MTEREIWKLVQNWVAIEEHRYDRNILEHIAALNGQNHKLKSYHLELYCDNRESEKIALFFIIRPYLIQVFRGFVFEKDGTIWLDDWEMLEQISCDSIRMPEIIGRDKEKTVSFDIIASLVKEEAYIIDGISKDGMNYYLEKNQDGIYERVLETSHYMKIGPKRERQKLHSQVQKICISELDDIEQLKLVHDGEEILPLIQKQSSEHYLIAIDLINSLLKKTVGKVYQLL